MVMTPEDKARIIEEYKTHEGDTGSPEVQVALLTSRITYLTSHFKTHAKDFPLPYRSSEAGWSASQTAQLPEEKRRSAVTGILSPD